MPIRGRDSNYNQLEKPKNEMISRRSEEVVSSAIRRRSRNAEISHFLTSLRAGELRQSSALLVANDAEWHQFASSRLESCLNSLRSIDYSSNPAPFGLFSKFRLKIS